MNEFWKRMIIPFYNTKKTVESIKTYGLVEGIKEDSKELAKEAPIINTIYKMGKTDGVYEGKKQGYIRASKEYEDKLLKQAQKFKNQKVLLKKDINERDLLLKEYEEYIESRVSEYNRLTIQQENALHKMKKEYEELLAQI